MLNLKGCSLYQVGKTMQLLAVTRKGHTIFAAGSLHYSGPQPVGAGIVYDKFCYREVQTILNKKLANAQAREKIKSPVLGLVLGE